MAPEVPGMGGFFPGLLGDLLKLLRSDAPFPFELSVQLATTIAVEETENANIDPLERMRLERLLSVAELQVADVTGMTTAPGGRATSLVALGRADWARRALESSKPLFENLAGALIPAIATPPEPDGDDPDAQAAALLARWTGAVAPAIVAMQFGSIVGHLAQRALGQYELLVPRHGTPELAIPAENLAAFAADWSLSPDDAALYLLVRDLTAHAILGRPHISERLETLLVAHAEGFRADLGALEDRFGEAGAGADDISSMMRLLGDPSALGQPVDTPELRRVRDELGALAAAIGGYVDWASAEIGARTIGAVGTIAEALRRHEVDKTADDRERDALFGQLSSRENRARGEAFVRGVLERGGADDLAKLWVVEENLPTPAEIEAPGLWLARINLPGADDQPGGSGP